MNWHPVPGQPARRSECQRYTVDAIKIRGIWIYQAWRVKDYAILHTGTAEECRAACERDAA